MLQKLSKCEVIQGRPSQNGYFEFINIWFHVKSEWQTNCTISTPCFYNFTFWKFLEHSVLLDECKSTLMQHYWRTKSEVCAFIKHMRTNETSIRECRSRTLLFIMIQTLSSLISFEITTRCWWALVLLDLVMREIRAVPIKNPYGVQFVRG